MQQEFILTSGAIFVSHFTKAFLDSNETVLEFNGYFCLPCEIGDQKEFIIRKHVHAQIACSLININFRAYAN